MDINSWGDTWGTIDWNGDTEDIVLKKVNQFIDNKVNVDMQNNWGWTILSKAAYHGYGQVVKRLIEEGANLDLQDEYNYTALMRAIDCRQDECSMALIEAGCNIELQNHHHETAYDMAIKKKWFEVAEKIKKAQEELNIKRYEERDKAEQKRLEEEWSNTWGKIDWKNDSDKKMIEKAESFGGDVNIAILSNYNRTPLMCAVTMGKGKFVDYLISKGADVDKKDSYGFTPLMVAAVKGNIEIVQKLLDAKADVTVTRKGANAFDLAKKYGHEDIAKLLTPKPKNLFVIAPAKLRKGR